MRYRCFIGRLLNTHRNDLLHYSTRVFRSFRGNESGFGLRMNPNMLRVTACWLIMSGMIAVQMEGTSSAPVIGTIVSAHGTWCDDSEKPCAVLWRMYPVKQDSKLVRVPPTNGQETIAIRTRWGVKEIFDCSNPRELGCKGPLDLSRIIVQERPKNVVAAFLDAVSELAADRPKVYETFREGILQVRGSDGQVLSDGVAKLSRQGLGLDKILTKLDDGNYLLELCALNAAGEPNYPDRSVPVDYSWNAKHPALYPASDAHAGMYRLYRWDNKTGAPRRTREYADVLVADETRYQTLADDFHQVVEATRNWDADDSTAPALRRAYLFTLSRQ